MFAVADCSRPTIVVTIAVFVSVSFGVGCCLFVLF